MLARVFAYSALQAKTRALKAWLLKAEDWSHLLSFERRQDFWQYLRGTKYGPYLRPSPKGKPALESELLLYRSLFDDYNKILRFLTGGRKALIQAFGRRFEAENLKTLIRGLWRRQSTPEIQKNLYPLGALSPLKWVNLLRAEKIPSLVESLRRTIYYPALKQALTRFKAEGHPFPLEIAIEIACFQEIARVLKKLHGKDQKTAGNFLRSFIDLENLDRLLRFRFFYGFSPEESLPYLLPGGRLSLKKWGQIAWSEEIGSFLSRFSEEYPFLSGLKALEAIKTKIWEHLTNLARGFFQEEPFHLGLVIGYLYLKEIEIRKLEALASCLRLGLRKPAWV